MKKLENQLENLYNSYLEDFSLELSDHRIRFKTINDQADCNELIFEGVKAFFYADPNRPLDLKSQDPVSLSSIVFCNSGFGEFAIAHATRRKAPTYATADISIPNFNLCFGDASFFIEAKSITINEHKFTLKRGH